ncbi:MAG TPA: DUF3015 domain-containing protein [Nitrospiria bacterium]|nr:DUF3015 domain-containing protein [Nitrospiria bacterium]
MTKSAHVFLFGIILTVLIAAPALADISSDTGPGCGLGKMLFGQPNFSGKHHIMQQSFAATTNGTFFSQTFGISFGTSGCTNDGVFAGNQQKVNAFAEINLDHLRQEMARGQGEYLASFASLIGVPADRRNDFYALTQENYSTLFKSERTTAHEMLAALEQELAAHPGLVVQASS